MEEEDQPAEPARLERSLPSNPYDFSGPAGDGVFAGRRGEQQRLDEFAASLADGRPRHLLIHGRRGIGKTSLIGRLDEIASKQRVLVASVCLDEGGVLETPFLVACVVSLASAAVELGAFGGPSGPFPSALEDALIGAVVDPTLGPLRAARFSGIQSNNERIPDALITRDLHDIRDAAAEVGIGGIVLVVDEADYLSASPSAAQRLRNLFITHGQVSTILVGTEAISVDADGPLAPLGRHYLRMEVPPFGDRGETRMCLMNPLKSAKIDYSHMVSPELVRDVHTLTAGRPLEIAMLGNLMYDQMVATESSVLELSSEVLDNTAVLLRPGVEQITLSVLRALDPEDIGRAARFCVSPELSLQEHALLSLAFREPSVAEVAAARASLMADWVRLAAQNLAVVDGEILRPAFGDWARLYLKYRAKVLGVLDADIEGNYADRLAQKLADLIVEVIHPARVVTVMLRSRLTLDHHGDADAAREFELLRAQDIEGFLAGPRVFADMPMTLQPPNDTPGLTLSVVPFEIGEFGFSLAMVLDLAESDQSMEAIDVDVTDAVGRAASYQVEIGKLDSVAVRSTLWARAGIVQVAELGAAVASTVWRSGDKAGGQEVAETVFSGVEERLLGFETLYEGELRLMNNLGFMRLACGDFEGAHEMLSRSAVRGGLVQKDKAERTILAANLAVVTAALGHEESLSWCKDIVDGEPVDDEGMVLFAYLARRLPDDPARLVVVEDADPLKIARSVMASVYAEHGDAIAATASLGDLGDGEWSDLVRAAVTDRLAQQDLNPSPG